VISCEVRGYLSEIHLKNWVVLARVAEC
jgi:hypothetical protein